MENKPKQSNELLARALCIMRELEVRKALFAELDALTLELRAGGFVSGIQDGIELELRDNFDETNIQWRMAAVKRYELVEKKAKRATKKASGE